MKSNRGFIQVSNEFWDNPKMRRMLKRHIKVLNIIEEVNNFKLIVCRSKYFTVKPKEGYKLPQYIFSFKNDQKRFLFWKYTKTTLTGVTHGK